MESLPAAQAGGEPPLGEPLDPQYFDAEFHEKKRLYTEVFLMRRQDDRRLVLLGRKKRGFKEGLIFGFGGKVEAEDASIRAAAARELWEESGVRLPESALEEVGQVYVQFNVPVKKYLEIHAFRVDVEVAEAAKASGGEGEAEPQPEDSAAPWRVSDAVETEEMAPMWYDVEAVPWEQCLPNVRIWFPLAMHESGFTAKFALGEEDAVLFEEVKRKE